MKIIELTDLTNEYALPYAGLTEAQLRREDGGLFIAESVNVIACAVKAGYEPVSILAERKRIPAIERDLGSVHCPVLTGEADLLEHLTGFRLSRGVLCAMRRRPLPSVSDVLDGKGRVCVLEGVGDPTNIGAIFRSAAALGMDAVLLGTNCCDPLHRRAARVSMGSVFLIPWTWLPCREDERNRIDLSPLREAGFETAAAALTEASISVTDARLKGVPRLAVVLGSEGPGLSPATIAECDHTVRIPMYNGVDSLNVAAASAVLFWELAAKREQPLV